MASNSRPTAPPSDLSLDRHEQRRWGPKTTTPLRPGAPMTSSGAPALLQKSCFSIGWLSVRCLRRPSGSGIAMGTPGAPAGSLFVPSASAPPRKRAAGETGVARSKQRVLNEEEYIEVPAWRALATSGPLPRSAIFSSPLIFVLVWELSAARGSGTTAFGFGKS